jgi:tetratricopeptide (TPR) repeat protein
MALFLSLPLVAADKDKLLPKDETPWDNPLEFYISVTPRYKLENHALLTTALLNMGDLNRSIELAQRIWRSPLNVQIMTQIYTASAKSGKQEQSRAAHAMASMVNFNTNDNHQMAFLAKLIANTIAESGDQKGTNQHAFDDAVEERIKNSRGWLRVQQLANCGLFRNALKEARKLTSDRRPDRNAKRALTQFAWALAESGNAKKESEIFRQIVHAAQQMAGDDGNVLKEIARALISAGEFNQAMDLALKASDESTMDGILRDICEGLAASRDNGRSKAFLELTVREIAKMSDNHSRESAIKSLAPVLAEMGDMENAIELTQTHRSTRAQIEALVEIAKTFDKSVDKKQIIATFDIAIATALVHDGSWSQAEALVEIAKTFDKLHDRESIIGIFKKAITLVLKSNFSERAKEAALSNIAIALIKAGEFKLAIEVPQKINHAGHKGVSLDKIAIALVEAGEFKLAIEVPQRIESARYKGWALWHIALTMAKTGEITQATKAAQKIQNLITKQEGSAAVHKALNESGDVKGFNGSQFNAARQNPEFILRAISKTLANDGAINQAIMIAQKIQNDKNKAEALKVIGLALAKAGSFEKAMETLKQSFELNPQMADATTKESYKRASAYAFADIGEFKQAIEHAIKIESAHEKARALKHIAVALTIETEASVTPPARRIKKTFTTEEKKIAERITKALRTDNQ